METVEEKALDFLRYSGLAFAGVFPFPFSVGSGIQGVSQRSAAF